MKKIASVSLALILLIGAMVITAISVSAADTSSADGLSLTINTDKDSYTASENVDVSIAVKNNNSFVVENVKIESIIPEGLKLKSGNLTKEIQSLAAGESLELAAVYIADDSNTASEPTSKPSDSTSSPTSNPNTTGSDSKPVNGSAPDTGYSSNPLLWITIMIMSGAAVALLLIHKKKAKSLLSVVLCLGLLTGSIGTGTISAHAASEQSKSIFASKTVNVDDIELEIKATATYLIDSSTGEEPQLDETYKVTFVLNDGSNGAYALQVVNSNDNATEPSAPEKKNYSFTGWYTEPAAVNKYDFSSPVTDNLTLYAGWGSPTGEEGAYGTSSNEETTYSITGIEVENGNVITTINVNSASALVVRFLDDNTGALLHTVSVQTPDFCELTPVSISINFDLPEYYVVEADLYDSNTEKLCETYQCIKYTSEYDAFDDLTVNDFGDKTVLNFDDNQNDNFGVLNEDVIEIHQDTNLNVLTTIVPTITNDSETYANKYQFTYADSSIDNLIAGNVILAKDTNGQYQLFKIASITKTGNGEYSVLSSTDVELSDFYDTLKVDLDDNNADEAKQQPVKAQTLAQPKAKSMSNTMMLASVNVIDVDTELSASLGGKINFTPVDWLEINGSLTGTGKVEIEMIYDAVFFGKDYFSCSIITNIETKIEINVTAEVDNGDKITDELKLAKVPIPTPIPGLTVYVAQTIPMEWSISGGGNFTYTNTTKSGFTYDSNSGYHPVEKKESSLTVKLEGKAEIKFGPKFEVGIAFCEKVVKVSIGVQAGIDATATAELGATGTNAESKHACTLCVSGECEWFVEVKAEMSICIVKDILEGKPIDATLFEVKGPIKFGGIDAKFYLSIINASDSMFGGYMKFGGGDCPNKTWRTIIKTQNSAAEDISGVNVTIKKQNRSVATTSSGELLYLTDGIYVATATIDGTNVSKSFVVNGSAQELIINPDSASGKLSGKVCTSGTDSVVTDATVLISQGEMVIASLTTDANGSYTATLPDGTYRIEITKNSYIPFISYETVSNAETTYLETALMINGTRDRKSTRLNSSH